MERTSPLERLAGPVAIAVGVGGLAYSIAFVTYLEGGSTAAAKLSSFLLMAGGLAAVVVFTGLYERVRAVDPPIALLALVAGILAAAGAAVHGAYDLANFINPPAAAAGDLPNPVDPRGFMTFAMSAAAVALFSWLILRADRLPRRLGTLGFVGAALLIWVYLGRLIILNPKSPRVLVAAVLSGFVVNPVWFVWLGFALRSDPQANPTA
jgi:hypothetical protein